MSALIQAVSEILRPGGPLSGTLAGYEARPGQLAMAQRVARALEDDERLLVEAGTGTGKTIAYLVPAILSGRKVVVATGTKTLQDQIARIDIPRLRAVLQTPFTFTVMKGLSNYLCLRRFDEHARQMSLPGNEPAELQRIRAWMAETETGDRADLDELSDESALWREISATAETRLGSRCPYFERCFVTNMRRRSTQSQIILTNHHLFFADLALRSRWPEAQVLPPYEAVIFDEAHQIEDVATEFFGTQVSTQRLQGLARDVLKALVPPAAVTRASRVSRRIQGATTALADALRAQLPAPRGGMDEVRVPTPSDLWTARSALGLAPLPRYHELDTVLEETAAFFERLSEEEPASESGAGAATATGRTPSAGAASVFSGLARRASAIRDELGQMVDSTRRDHVQWITASPRSVSLRASPVDVAPVLAQSFDAHAGPIIFTSATLTTDGGFSYMRKRLGLGDTAAEATFPSPFRYHRQALIYIAADLPEPNTDDFALAAAERLLELARASSGRALFLFTSFRNLRITEDYLRAKGNFPLLVQGERPRHVLLDSLRQQVGSVLLATQSFWEGVDVPGEALSLVAIDRLPFSVPDDPLVAARIQRIRDAGADPFADFQLPRAALALKQGFGRLVRSQRDTGVVAILDGRIARRQYGAVLLRSLPLDCPRTESLDDVTRFFADRARPDTTS